MALLITLTILPMSRRDTLGIEIAGDGPGSMLDSRERRMISKVRETELKHWDLHRRVERDQKSRIRVLTVVQESQ